MGIRQGVTRYTSGYIRKLTNSEKARGYMFISNDRLIKGNKDIKIIIGNKNFSGENIDNSGRIVAGKDVIQDIGNKDITFKLSGNRLTITF
ncbi:hypothetical protein IPM62_06000 [Candidatus Woesebacteria bacterium]|nr:MAG: hypothetical protein IPM62_06000 [Candidatus Woesebacteria bacterium]